MGSATSVDVEEHLYQLAADMGITVVTSSQVTTNFVSRDKVSKAVLFPIHNCRKLSLMIACSCCVLSLSVLL